MWVANGMGNLEALHVAERKMSGALKGAGGSVRTMRLHPGGRPLLASAGLDRFLRIHDTGSRKCVQIVWGGGQGRGRWGRGCFC